MKKNIYKFFTPISNADDSILLIDLPGDRKFIKQSVDYVVGMICEAVDYPDHEVHGILESLHCFDIERKHVFLMESILDIELNADCEEPISIYEHNLMERFNEETDDIIKILRLCAKGDLDHIGHYVYLKTETSWEYSATFFGHYKSLRRIPFALTRKDVEKANHLLKNTQLPLNRPFLNLALDNFNLSYSIPKLHLAFLSLMIAMEALFNVGRSELRYRVSRNCSMLLSRTQQEFELNFQRIKRLYDKRSQIVHSGNLNGLDINDLLSCQELVSVHPIIGKFEASICYTNCNRNFIL